MRIRRAYDIIEKAGHKPTGLGECRFRGNRALQPCIRRAEISCLMVPRREEFAVMTIEANTLSDYELAAASAAGDAAAFEKLYQLHHRRVFSLCLRMLGNATEAEDLTQDVFVQLFRKIGSFRGESAFTTWLHRLTVNQVLMHFRKRGVKLEQTTEEGEMHDVVDAATERPQSMPIVDRIALEKAVSELPPGYRTVFVLHDVEGHEHEQIAKMLGCSVGTSKSQLHKARMRLRELLQKKA